jgi:hypothetical protein
MPLKSRIFHTDKYKEIELKIVSLLNAEEDFLSVRTATSTRAAGDAIQAIVSEHFEELLGEVCAEYSATFARRAMADLAFKDCDGLYCIVDVKTHRSGTVFNMPNLTSVERLARFYEDDQNFFVLLVIQYSATGTKIHVDAAHFVPIEFLAWECLTVGALGWGQIQIANANFIKINGGYPRKQWMIELCDTMLEFYPKEILKIGKRVQYFQRVKAFWQEKPDV